MRTENTNEITVAPNISDLGVTNSFEFLSNDTTLRQALPPETISDSEISAAIDYRNAFKQGDVLTALNVFFANINGIYFKQADFSIENILYWFQKLKYSNKEITSYRSQVSFYGDNILNNQLPSISLFSSNAYNSGSFSYDDYFNNVSDSIGIVANSKYVQLDSTLPLFDTNQDYYGVPIPISASLENKISANTRNVMYDLSQKTTTYMRHNLMGVGYTNLTLQQNLAADASTSHGLNLINDLPTFVTINESLGMLKEKLASLFSEAKIFGFIQYVSNIANQTAMNLRDIFPVASDDKDFVVITSAERASASQAIRDQEVNDALAEQALYAQQQNFQLVDSIQRSNSNSLSNSSLEGNLTPITNIDAAAESAKYNPGDPDYNADPQKIIDSDPGLANVVGGIGAGETEYSDKEAATDRYNQISNNSNVRRGVQREGLTLEQAQAKYGDYGYFQMNQDNVNQAIKAGVDPSVAAALNNGGGRGNYSKTQQQAAVMAYIRAVKPNAAAAASRGDYTSSFNQLKGIWPSLPGGLSHRPALDKTRNSYLKPVTPATSIAATTAPRPGTT